MKIFSFTSHGTISYAHLAYVTSMRTFLPSVKGLQLEADLSTSHCSSVVGNVWRCTFTLSWYFYTWTLHHYHYLSSLMLM
jgi:hypothetical protein